MRCLFAKFYKLNILKTISLVSLISTSLLAVALVFYADVLFTNINTSSNFRQSEVVDEFFGLPNQKIITTPIDLADSAEVAIIFGGDVMLGRHVQTLQEQSGSFTTAWELIADIFRQADLAVVNLESPFSNQPPYPDEGFIFKAKPANIEGLKLAGIDLVTLANNHFSNAGISGAEFTFDHLQNNNVKYLGAGHTAVEAYSGTVVEVNGLHIGFIAQSYDVGFTATDHSLGIATLDTVKLTQSIVELKEKSDIVVAIFHGGIEYVTYPNSDQKEFAYAAIDAGADLVIGHHPHWIQNIEEYKGKYIFYSLGNLIFDQNWSQSTSEGLVLEVKATKTGIKSFKFLPIIIENNFQPRFADLSEDNFFSLDKIINPITF